MRDLRTGDIVPDKRITFDDGILYIVSLLGGEGKWRPNCEAKMDGGNEND